MHFRRPLGSSRGSEDVALIVITGGARSGKSHAAERLAMSRHALGAEVVVAVFGHSAAGADVEFAERIARHQSTRPVGFRTVEASAGMSWLGEIADGVLLVVDCLGTLFGRIMEDAWTESAAQDTLGEADAATLPAGFEAQCAARLDEVVSAFVTRDGDTIVVTNEVGDGIVPTHATGRLFRDLLGRANHALVESADAAYFVVAGRVVDLVALPRHAAWPED